MSIREVPPIKYDKDIERLVRYYRRSYSSLVKELVTLLDTQGFTDLANQQASIVRQLSLILERNNEDVRPILEELIKDSYNKGQAEALVSLGKADTLAEASKQVAFTLISQQRLEALMTDTFEDLLSMTDRTSTQIKKAVRDVVGEAMRMNAVKSVGVESNKKDIIEKLLKQGFSKKVKKNFKGVTDSAGRKWALDKYVSMVVRTKLQQAQIEGVILRSIEEGSDLAVISSRGSRDACKNYEGMVISLTGATKGLPRYQDLRGSNFIFHPNCKHTITPLYEVSDLPKAVQDKHFKQLENAKNKNLI